MLTSLDEKSRWFWLLGETEPAQKATAGAETQLGHPTPAELGATEAARGSSTAWTTIWIVVRVSYVVVVAAGAGFLLWRARRLTSIYNVDARVVVPVLEQVFPRIGVSALRTGHSFLIRSRPSEAAPSGAALHVDLFPAMRHVTLRWRPSDAAVRREIEQELTRTLAELPPAEQEPVQGGCLSLVGVAVFSLALIAGGLLILFWYYPPH